MIIKLTNSKDRVVFVAEYNESGTIDFEHECGRGINHSEPEEIFLPALCCLNDNTSCKIEGSHAKEFSQYCKEHKDWLCSTLKARFV